MTKKDYALIARAIAQAKKNIEVDSYYSFDNKSFIIQGVRAVRNVLAGHLAGDNPRFDAEKFFVACDEQNLDRLD